MNISWLASLCSKINRSLAQIYRLCLLLSVFIVISTDIVFVNFDSWILLWLLFLILLRLLIKNDRISTWMTVFERQRFTLQYLFWFLFLSRLTKHMLHINRSIHLNRFSLRLKNLNALDILMVKQLHTLSILPFLNLNDIKILRFYRSWHVLFLWWLHININLLQLLKHLYVSSDRHHNILIFKLIVR